MDDFRAWILRAYPDPTGDHVSHLAHDIRRDATWPGITTYDDLIGYLDGQGAVAEAMDAAEQAWDRYEQWCGEQA